MRPLVTRYVRMTRPHECSVTSPSVLAIGVSHDFFVEYAIDSGVPRRLRAEAYQRGVNIEVTFPCLDASLHVEVPLSDAEIFAVGHRIIIVMCDADEESADRCIRTETTVKTH